LLSHHYVCEQFIFIKAKRPRRQSEVGVIITMITMHFPRAAFSLYRIFPLAACRLPALSAKRSRSKVQRRWGRKSGKIEGKY